MATRRARAPAAAAIAAVAAVLAAGPTGAAAADADRGSVLYEQRCGACHALDAHRVGPLHRDVLGRRAGSAPGYDYSPALAGATIPWTEQNLDAWLRSPEALIPGQRMGYSVPERADREDIIAYLRRAATR